VHLAVPERRSVRGAMTRVPCTPAPLVAQPLLHPPVDSSQLALRGAVREYVAPDHSYGESFPGKQAPTVQLSLFDAGLTNPTNGFPKKCRVTKCLGS